MRKLPGCSRPSCSERGLCSLVGRHCHGRIHASRYPVTMPQLDASHARTGPPSATSRRLLLYCAIQWPKPQEKSPVVTNSSVRHRLPVLPGWRPSARNAHLCSVLGPAWRQPDKRAVVARSRARARGRQDHLESNPRSNGAIRPHAEHKANQSAPRTPEHRPASSHAHRQP